MQRALAAFVINGSVCFGFGLLAAAFIGAPADAQELPAGRWEGTLQIPGRELSLVVDLAPKDGGEWSGSIIVPGLNLAGAAISDVALNGNEISFSVKTALADQKLGPAKLRAHFDADGMRGDFVQAGNTARFALKKVGAAQITPPPRSTAVAKELEGEWQGSYELLGYPRKVTIKLQNRGAEGATADFLIVGKKENHLPVDLVTQEGNFLTIDSHETGLSFEGHAGKDEIKGTILQGPLAIPVRMQRTK